MRRDLQYNLDHGRLENCILVNFLNQHLHRNKSQINSLETPRWKAAIWVTVQFDSVEGPFPKVKKLPRHFFQNCLNLSFEFAKENLFLKLYVKESKQEKTVGYFIVKDSDAYKFNLVAHHSVIIRAITQICLGAFAV